jgi:hypothetical protein
MTASGDASTRFILTTDAAYLNNLAALWTVDPALAAHIEALSENATAHRVETSKSGLPTLSVEATNGRRVYLHSRYEPMAEARKLIERADVGQCMAFYLFGFGLGYHAELLFERSADEALLIVFEPDLRLLRAAFEQRDLSKLIETRRVLFFTAADKADLMVRLSVHAALISVGSEQILHAPSQQVAGEFHAQMRQWVDEFAAYTKTSLATLVLNARKTATNVARNIGRYLAAPSLARLKDHHKHEPAVIVSAGPSLRKNKHLLKDLQGRAVIIAVQTTLQPLLDMGIEPQFVTSLDYHEICTRFYEKLPGSISTELVAEPKANAAIFRMYPGPVTLLGNSYADSLLRELRLEKTGLQDGATVAHLAYYLAEHLGCDPIIFVGQDLGFSDGLCYAPGTSYEDVWAPELSRFCTVEMKQWEQIVRERFILRRIPDYQGRPMYTEERLFTYLQQFERDFARSSARIIDATEGGAAKRGTTTMTLAEAMDRFCTRPVKPSPPHPGIDLGRGREASDALRRRRDEGREIERITRTTLPLLEELRDHIDDQPRVNRLIASIDLLRARMNELGSCYDLITHLTQKSEMQRFKADRRIGASRISETERQRLQVGRDIENVQAMMQAAVDFQAMLDEVISLPADAAAACEASAAREAQPKAVRSVAA